MLMLVPVSVVMSGAALEANANEIIQDILDKPISPSITAAHKERLEELKANRSGNSIDKYKQLALLFDTVPSPGAIIWQDAALLVEFRNALMHFKPVWDNEADNDCLIRRLKSRIPTHSAFQSHVLFPYGYMTYGCAEWSVRSVLAFAAEFSALLGVANRFAAFDFTLPPPVI